MLSKICREKLKKHVSSKKSKHTSGSAYATNFLIHSFPGTIGLFPFPVRKTADGCTVALSTVCTVLMALWVSSCHQVAQCKLLNLQSAELTPGVINQTLRLCEPPNVFLGSLLLFAHRSVNSPTLPTNHSHRETRRER